MKIAVIGSGYVGLVVGACLAESGNDVISADIDEKKVELLNSGKVGIHEPGLESLVRKNLAAGRLAFTTDVHEAVQVSSVIFIAVGTPPDEDGSADLSHVLGVACKIGEAMNGEKIVITKSTVPVGTAQLVREEIQGRSEHPVHVCSNPEFLKEGAAVEDFIKPDRVVLGVDSDYAEDILRDLYAPFVRTGASVLTMDVPSAEITKYAANAMLATRISFMNSIAELCEKTGADVDAVRQGVGSDIRIGSGFLFPGIGYGGSCFPKDVKALAKTMEDVGVDPSIIQAVDQVNNRQKKVLLERILEHLGDDLAGKTLAIWGLAFKPNTDDMREAPSIVTIQGLLERGARVVAHDPEAMEEAQRIFDERVEFVKGSYEAVDKADGLVIHTEWHPYRHPDFHRIHASMRRPIVFDGRNLYDPSRMAELGFEYISIGRTTPDSNRV